MRTKTLTQTLMLSCALASTAMPHSANAFFGFNPFKWGDNDDYYRDRYYRDRYWDRDRYWSGGPWGHGGGPWGYGGGPWGYGGGPWGYHNPWMYGPGWQGGQQKEEKPKLPE